MTLTPEVIVTVLVVAGAIAALWYWTSKEKKFKKPEAPDEPFDPSANVPFEPSGNAEVEVPVEPEAPVVEEPVKKTRGRRKKTA